MYTQWSHLVQLLLSSCSKLHRKWGTVAHGDQPKHHEEKEGDISASDFSEGTMTPYLLYIGLCMMGLSGALKITSA
jgi:hypothetical protein